jgi:hypothetical protein
LLKHHRLPAHIPLPIPVMRKRELEITHLLIHPTIYNNLLSVFFSLLSVTVLNSVTGFSAVFHESPS